MITVGRVRAPIFGSAKKSNWPHTLWLNSAVKKGVAVMSVAHTQRWIAIKFDRIVSYRMRWIAIKFDRIVSYRMRWIAIKFDRIVSYIMRWIAIKFDRIVSYIMRWIAIKFDRILSYIMHLKCNLHLANLFNSLAINTFSLYECALSRHRRQAAPKYPIAVALGTNFLRLFYNIDMRFIWFSHATLGCFRTPVYIKQL
jgi:hypothetical protein